jgi:hypothetical protein
MKRPEDAREISEIVSRDKARLRHLEDRLEVFDAGLSKDVKRMGKEFIQSVRQYQTRGEDMKEHSHTADLGEEKRKEKEEQTQGGRSREAPSVSVADIDNAQVAAKILLDDQDSGRQNLNIGDARVQNTMKAANELKDIRSNANTYKSAVKGLQDQFGKDNVRPPKMNEEYGPGTLSIGKQLAVLTLADNKMIAYRVQDFNEKYPEGGSHEIGSIKRTERGLQISDTRDRQKDEQIRKLEEERPKEAAREATRAISRTVGLSRGGRDLF